MVRRPLATVCVTLVTLGTIILVWRSVEHRAAVRLIYENGGAIRVEDDCSFDIHYVTFDITFHRARALDDARLALVLARVGQVEELNLKHTSVTASSVSLIAKLPRLRKLTLPHSALSLEAMKQLIQAPSLKELWVEASESEIDAIATELPNAEVRRVVDFP